MPPVRLPGRARHFPRRLPPLAWHSHERDDALARLRYVGAGAEVLQIRRICRGGAGLLRVGPGLLVGLLARLLVRRLLLLLCLLRIRGLASAAGVFRMTGHMFGECLLHRGGLVISLVGDDTQAWPRRRD